MSLRQVTSISPSQVELHETCNRKWWLNKVMGKPIPQHPSAALGELVHKGQEDYLSTGDEKKVHPLAVATLPILRSMRERGVKVEHAMKRQLRNGLIYNGRIDILDLGTKDENVITVVDWKTTGSPAYAKTADELRGNIQMLSYAYEATILDIDHRGPTAATPVVLSHIVIPTKGATKPFVTKTDPPLTVPEIRAGWGKIQTISDRMLETSKLESPDVVPGNKSACSAFGGCPFLETCAALKRTPPLSVPVTTPTLSQENNVMPTPTQIRFPRSYAKTLARIEAAGLLDAATGTVTVEDVAGAIEAPVEQVAALQALGEEGYTAWVAAGFPNIVTFAASRRAPTPTPTPPVNRGVMAPEARAVQTPAVVAPVAEAKAEPTEEEQAELWELLLSRGWSDTDIEGMSDEAFDAAVKLDAGPGDLDVTRGEDGQVTAVKKRKPAPAPVAEAKPEPRRRGRPVGSKNKPKEAPEAPEAPVPVQVEAAPVEEVEAKAEVAFERPPAAAEAVHEAKTGAVPAETMTKVLDAQIGGAHPTLRRLTLFIDCLPVKGIEYRRLEDVLAPIATQAASSWKNPKTGQVEVFDHYTLIPFGGGVQMVAAGVMRNISRPEFSGVIVANTSLPLTAAVLEVLLPVADVVVRGVR